VIETIMIAAAISSKYSIDPCPFFSLKNIYVFNFYLIKGLLLVFF
jgi:hypothetical protein